MNHDSGISHPYQQRWNQSAGVQPRSRHTNFAGNLLGAQTDLIIIMVFECQIVTVSPRGCHVLCPLTLSLG